MERSNQLGHLKDCMVTYSRTVIPNRINIPSPHIKSTRKEAFAQQVGAFDKYGSFGAIIVPQGGEV